MQSYHLYMTYRSPYARKVRIAMIEKDLVYTEEAIDLQNKPEYFLNKSVGTTVPTLICPDGLVLDDSTLILQYLEEIKPSLVPQTMKARYEMWNWEEMGDRLCEQNIHVFFENQKEQKRNEVFEKANKLTNSVIKMLSAQLKNKGFIMGEFSYADVSLACTMNWMSFRLKTDWSQEAGSDISTWLGRINERKSFQNTLPRL